MNKINKIILTPALLLGAGCTTVKKFFGIDGGEEEQVVPVENNPTGETVDNGVDFSVPQADYAEFFVVGLLIIAALLVARYFIRKKNRR